MSISKIKLSGGFFHCPKEFQFFYNHSQVATVIYGKNGSGKSSISRAFQEALNSNNKDSSENEFSSIEFYKLKPHPQQGTEIIPTEGIDIPCYVHNENFTHKTVSFNETGLEAIVMFGEQNDIKNDLDILEEDLEKAEKEYNKTNEYFEKISNAKEEESHLYFEEQIKNKLKEQWAVRQQKINEIKTLGRVDNSLFNEILNFPETNNSYENLMIEFQTKFEKYQKLKSIAEIEEIKLFLLPNIVYELVQLLSVELQHPVLSEKEQKILALYSSLDHTKTSEAKKFLMSSEKTCPVCFQNVESSYKLEVLETIRKILNSEDANTLINKISEINLEQFNLDFSTFESIVEKNKINNLKSHIESYNEFINKLEHELQNKINNPYSPISLDVDINKIVENINNSIKIVNSKIKNFNKEIKLKNKVADELRIINKNLAFIECIDLIKLYNVKYKNFLDSKKKKESLFQAVLNLKNKISKKLASLENVKIALELINNYLQYIFYEEKRLYLVPSKSAYKIMSRDQPVKPSSLSVGEKNIISLCYFFSTLFQNKGIEDLFKNECLLILDDPLSSFDFENKIGVYSFLRYILNKLHSGNSRSKSIIFSHDLDVLYNMVKVYSDLKIGLKEKKLKLFHLYRQELEEIDPSNYDEYSRLLQTIYDFTIDNSNNDLNIGNNLRRVLEAFATFNYKCGIEDLTRNQEIIQKIPEEYRDYFSNSMYRLILNTESHLKERSRLLVSTTFKEHFSIEEKTRTAKDILMYLYFLNPLHLKLHLNKGDDILLKIAQIESWIEETFFGLNVESRVAILS